MLSSFYDRVRQVECPKCDAMIGENCKGHGIVHPGLSTQAWSTHKARQDFYFQSIKEEQIENEPTHAVNLTSAEVVDLRNLLGRQTVHDMRAEEIASIVSILDKCKEIIHASEGQA